MSPTLSTLVSPALCPVCSSPSLKVVTSAVVSYDVMIDAETQELIVIGEDVTDSEWDDHSLVSCPTCTWQGVLSDRLKK